MSSMQGYGRLQQVNRAVFFVTLSPKADPEEEPA